MRSPTVVTSLTWPASPDRSRVRGLRKPASVGARVVTVPSSVEVTTTVPSWLTVRAAPSPASASGSACRSTALTTGLPSSSS